MISIYLNEPFYKTVYSHAVPRVGEFMSHRFIKYVVVEVSYSAKYNSMESVETLEANVKFESA